MASMKTAFIILGRIGYLFAFEPGGFEVFWLRSARIWTLGQIAGQVSRPVSRANVGGAKSAEGGRRPTI